MSEFLVPGIDAAIHLVSFLIMAKLLLIVVKIVSKGDAETKFINAALVIAGLVIIKTVFDARVDAWLPSQTAMIRLSALLGITFIGTMLLIFLRFAMPVMDASICAAVLVGVSVAQTQYVPILSAKVRPEGMTFGEFANLASNKYDEQKQVIEDLKNSEAFKAMAEAQKGKKAPTIAEAFDAIADLTSDENFSDIKGEFARGMEVIQARRAIMANMSEEERAQYKADMAAFMAEQGISENRYSLSALKSVDAEDVANMTAFMEQLQADMGGGPIDGPLPQKAEGEVRSLGDSLAAIASNIRGSELSEEDKLAMSRFMNLLQDAGVDTALVEAQAKVIETKGKDPVANTIMAALLETKSEMPIATLIANNPFGSKGSTAGDPNTTEAPALDDEGNPITEPEEKPLEFLPVPTKRGMVQVPDDDSLWDPWHSAAKSVPIQGFIKSKRNGQTEQQVVLGKRAIAVGETWTFTHRGARYTFRVDGIQEGQAYLSPVLEKESEALEASTKS